MDESNEWNPYSGHACGFVWAYLAMQLTYHTLYNTLESIKTKFNQINTSALLLPNVENFYVLKSKR